ncbi:hypothetical protein [Polynucleobacter bastaniensis]|jgi:hypothetical protein|uniref:hypothetical protein n=1 Tax=Polynucleobacter bastaniensis TaxID=2081039 RepID=UPI001C0E1DEC|nr:hypothetical protein [Polynucleobacter bastaniensis]MBU3597107.1 hypothetical protein [Polynucleobacter bastaniensis]
MNHQSAMGAPMEFKTATKSAPQYEADEGLLTMIQISQIKSLISSGVKKKLVKSSLIRDKKDPASA